jgi:CHAT domain-containing protein
VRRLDVLLVPLLGRARLTETERRRRDALLKERAELHAKLSRQAAEASERLLLPVAQVHKHIPADAAIVLWVDAFAIGEHWGCVLRAKGPPRWQRLAGSGPGKAWTKEDLDLPARLLALLSKPRSNPAERQRLIRAVREQRLDPLRPHLKGVRRLFVVPAWPMGALPVEVLTEDFQVSYVPSASLFDRARQQHRPLRASTLLALGDPVFTPQEPARPPAQGVLLTEVLPGGEAQRAGLQAGDVLLRLADRRLRGVEDLRQALAGVPARLLSWRDGREQTALLTTAGLGVRVDGRPPAEAWRNWRELNASLLRGTGHKPLPATRQEVRALARLVPAPTLLLGSAASEQSLRQLASSGKLKGFRQLHFATHAEVSATDPKQSALILAQDRLPPRPAEAVLRGEKPIDGRLTVETILGEWELDADLVVLSACRTGQGREAGGEGLLGFTQAFLQKGARSVVASRWKVDDTATALFVVRFYENLLGKRAGTKPMGRAAALAEARRWLRDLPRTKAGPLAARCAAGTLRGTEGDETPAAPRPVELPGGARPYEHPFFWAAFILVGDPD